MKYIAITFFLLGAVTYFIFPKDATVPDPAEPNQDTSVLISNENGCATYQYPYEVGKDLQPLMKVVCSK